ncbi:SIR2 family protein [Saccharicrinis aurantiacus]|uniref:SIR2 family protein n=1 Tax=Saccharicrinis aurantiacus TaxID=1849719 RepID=UPI0024915EA9|nr:SIR2 family protein [Saccharicrinis aurantiacus]
MRRSVFKGELFELKQKIDNSAVYEVFEHTVFQESYKDRGTKLFFLREEITSRGKLKEKLSAIDGLDANIHSEICEILTINDDLEIPSDLKEAIKNEDVVLFIGAGASKSKPLDYPSWQDLANKAINLLSTEGYINNFEKDRLFQISDPKEVLTIFENFCPRTKEVGKNFYKVLFDKKGLKDNQNIYDLLVKKEFGWQLLTTNIDVEILNALAKRDTKNPDINKEVASSSTVDNITFDEAFNKHLNSAAVINVNTKENTIDEKSDVVFLHGIVDDVENSIFTTKDYLKTYFNGNSEVKNVLRKIFQDKTVLFIGYGLSEFTILESIINFDDSTESKKHYSLYPTFHSDVHTLNIKQKAFKELNIELVPYYIDFNGYNRLSDVIENWHRIIKEEKGSDFFDDRNLLNDIL